MIKKLKALILNTIFRNEVLTIRSTMWNYRDLSDLVEPQGYYTKEEQDKAKNMRLDVANGLGQALTILGVR